MGFTQIVEPITTTSTSIVVESVDQFVEKNGSILIGDEVIYYESTKSAPNIALSPGISYEQVKLKWTIAESQIDSYDGTTTFPLRTAGNPAAPPTPQHLVVSLYGQILIPELIMLLVELILYLQLLLELEFLQTLVI